MTTFAELNLHPSVARALTARGYETPTGVQAAVMQPENAGRDLLISSQTGSGKTIAFGMAMVETLLGGDEQPRAPRPRPVALAIVPTRELAVQVREELGWLLQHSGLRLASFTGGTGVVGDLRALQRGVDVVVGTPGRLVDLLRRKQLNLADLKVVVLDEADEMLDLGFREDLETLLQAAPPERRTLMLSATIPSEIRAMARKFQRDALSVDPRKNGDGAGSRGDAASHGDITYVAHLVGGGDRLAAVVNVLRAFDLSADGMARAIVFVTTRDSVSGLHSALVSRGFSATAIAGDRAQAERDRALEKVRSGEARVLVATNVAARGLHLPDVDLIIHADLPLNAESLTHRSGRTGRAGRKGTAVLIATAAERRKAERLLAAANVRVPWTPPPSGAEIGAAARERLADELARAPESGIPFEADELLRRLEGKLPDKELLRRLAAREVARMPLGEVLREIQVPTGGNAERLDSRRSPAELSRGGVLFRINLGAKDQADPRWMLPLICRRGGVTRREVGAIRIGPKETMFEIAGDAAADFALAAAEVDPRAKHVFIQRVDGEPHRAAASGRADRSRGPRPERGRPPEREHRPKAPPPPRPDRVEGHALPPDAAEERHASGPVRDVAPRGADGGRTPAGEVQARPPRAGGAHTGPRTEHHARPPRAGGAHPGSPRTEHHARPPRTGAAHPGPRTEHTRPPRVGGARPAPRPEQHARPRAGGAHPAARADRARPPRAGAAYIAASAEQQGRPQNGETGAPLRVHPKRAQRERLQAERPAERAPARDRPAPGGHGLFRGKPKTKHKPS